jgi:glycosyltransferase involved in cell wall biosynthesis
MTMKNFSSPVSAYIVCFNEARFIADCVESLDFCREIIIVDSGSTDGTLEIINDIEKRGFPIRLLKREWPGFARQKQFALEQCTQNWCLSIDADERIDSKLKTEIVEAVRTDSDEYAGWYVRLREWLPGYGYESPLVATKYKLRLSRNGMSHFSSNRQVHEGLEVKGNCGHLRDGYLLHYRALSIEEEAAKAVNYAVLKSRERIAAGRKPSIVKLLLSPSLNFLKFYILRRYVFCRTPGFIFSAMMAYYSFITEADHYRATRDLPERNRIH